MSFTITCNNCRRSLDITQDNAGKVINMMGWGPDIEDAKPTKEAPIAIYTFYDMIWNTVVCECGNKVTE
jgi:hypothetical protein